jgi:signal transduction histidine kinase
MRVSLETFDVKQLLDQLIANVKPMLQRNRNILTAYCNDSLGPITADGVDVREVLMSILRNASAHTRQGSITVEVDPCTAAGGAGVRFSVTDTGVGMSQDQKARAFQIATAAESIFARREGATGLTLSAIASRCESMGGTLNLRSRPGEGSCFTVVLPLHAAADTRADAATERVA